MRTGRPKKQNPKSAKLVISIEPQLKSEIEILARESRRSLSDYCRYVLEEHFWAVSEAEGLAVREEGL